MAKKAAQINWRSASLEVAGIVFAVLLALWLEAWREDAELEAQAQENLKRITAEISQNRADLIASVEIHKVYIEGLDKALKSGEVSIAGVSEFLKIEGGATSDAAWQSARLSASVSQLSADTTTQLAALYDTQSYYTRYLNFFFQRYIDLVIEIETGPEKRIAAQKFRQHLAITNSLADQLLGRYDTFLRAQGVDVPAMSTDGNPSLES